MGPRAERMPAYWPAVHASRAGETVACWHAAAVEPSGGAKVSHGAVVFLTCNMVKWTRSRILCSVLLCCGRNIYLLTALASRCLAVKALTRLS